MSWAVILRFELLFHTVYILHSVTQKKGKEDTRDQQLQSLAIQSSAASTPKQPTPKRKKVVEQLSRSIEKLKMDTAGKYLCDLQCACIHIFTIHFVSFLKKFQFFECNCIMVYTCISQLFNASPKI